MRGYRWRGLLVPVLLFAGLAATVDGTAAADEPADSKLQLVLDSSGSMKEPDASGTSKINAAKQALNEVVDQLPDQSTVGLRVYGATVFDKKQPGACTDSQQVVPMGPVDKPALKAEIAKYRPYGETPIAYALQQAARDVGTQGKRTILLVSDGEETCDADPCAVAKAVHDKGIDLRIDVVGLDVDAGARQQLSCIAERGGGTYYDAKDADDLIASLDQAALRAFRPFTLSGLPVVGTSEQNGAPEVEPGQYTDKLGGTKEEGGRKYYTIRRAPGSTTHIGFTAYPEAHGDMMGYNDAATLKLTTPDGDECATQTGMQMIAGTRALLVNSVSYNPAAEPGNAACDASDRLVLEVVRGTGQDIANPAPETGTIPFEFLVIEEPALADRDGLPEPMDVAPSQESGAPSSPILGEVAGGGGFADAPILRSGTWKDSLRPGEVLFYRVRADWGQTPKVSIRFRPNSRAQSVLGPVGVNVKVDAFSPARAAVLTGDTHTINSYSAGQTTALNATLVPVRFRNRESTMAQQQAMSLAGHYYFAVTMERLDGELELPMEISVAVDGEPSDVPNYKQPASPDPERTKEEADGTEQAGKDDSGDGQAAAEPAERKSLVPVAAVGGGGILVLAGLILAIAFLRGRKPRAAAPVRPPDQGPSNAGPPYYGRRP